MLGIVGFGDQFEQLRKEALESVPQPEPPTGDADDYRPMFDADIADTAAPRYQARPALVG